MCVTYCGSFPILFKAIDREIDSGRAEGSENVDAATVHAVTDHCWQCKLCYIKCPYTPDEGAHELLDFPRLMAREKAQRSRRDGVPLVDQVLGEPQLIGKLSAGPQAKLANFVNRQRLVRKAVEKVTGISAEFPLPPIATQAFSDWHRTHERNESAGLNGQVVLFPTCYGEYNFPEVPRAAVQVLEPQRLRRARPRAAHVLRDAQFGRGRFGRRARQDPNQRRAALAPGGSRTTRRGARPHLRLHDEKRVAPVPRYRGGRAGRWKNLRFDGVSGWPAARKEARKELPARSSGASRTTPPATCALRRSRFPGRACCRCCRTPTSASSSVVRRSTAPGA